MNTPQKKVLSAQIIIEPGTEAMDRTTGYVIQALKAAFRNIRDGSVVVTIYDENERLLGVDLSGTPSKDLQDRVDDLVDKLENTTAVRVE